jgi:hypothetical protein
MAHTIFVVAVAWLALDALAVVLLLCAGGRRSGERSEDTGDLFAACPISRAQPEKRAARGPRRRFRRARDRASPELAAVPARADEPL